MFMRSSIYHGRIVLMISFWNEIQIPTQSQPPTTMLITFPSQLPSYSSSKKKAFQFSVVVSHSSLATTEAFFVSPKPLCCALFLSLAPLQHTHTHSPPANEPLLFLPSVAGGGHSIPCILITSFIHQCSIHTPANN